MEEGRDPPAGEEKTADGSITARASIGGAHRESVLLSAADCSSQWTRMLAGGLGNLDTMGA